MQVCARVSVFRRCTRVYLVGRETDMTCLVCSRAWHDRADIRNAYDNLGARVCVTMLMTVLPFSHRSSLFIAVNTQLFTCGSGKVAQGVKRVLTDVIKEARSYTDEEAAAAFERAIQDRYATDIFE